MANIPEHHDAIKALDSIYANLRAALVNGTREDQKFHYQVFQNGVRACREAADRLACASANAPSIYSLFGEDEGEPPAQVAQDTTAAAIAR